MYKMIEITGLERCGRLRIRQDGSVYRIDEIVTPDGKYITWNNAFTSSKNALQYIVNHSGTLAVVAKTDKGLQVFYKD